MFFFSNCEASEWHQHKIHLPVYWRKQSEGWSSIHRRYNILSLQSKWDKQQKLLDIYVMIYILYVIICLCRQLTVYFQNKFFIWNKTWFFPVWDKQGSDLFLFISCSLRSVKHPAWKQRGQNLWLQIFINLQILSEIYDNNMNSDLYHCVEWWQNH